MRSYPPKADVSSSLTPAAKLKEVSEKGPSFFVLRSRKFFSLVEYPPKAKNYTQQKPSLVTQKIAPLLRFFVRSLE